MRVQDIRIEDYTYELPPARIARYPLPERDHSQLLVYREGQIHHDRYYNFAHYLAPQDRLVVNNTRVLPARLQFVKASGAQIEVFCLEPVAELSSAMGHTGSTEWYCLVGNGKRWKQGAVALQVSGPTGEVLQLEAEAIEKNDRQWRVRFHWSPADLPFATVLSWAGAIPLPPYLDRAAEALDYERYQTVYAQWEGSVAAPTAGLHFTERIFAALAAKGVAQTALTLHVGAGTFQPVKSATLADHPMHAEYFVVSRSALVELAHAGRLVAVGTTSLRTLESLYLMGAKLLQQPHLTLAELEIKQWDAYQLPVVPRSAAFQALLAWLNAQGLSQLAARTQLLIAPGYTPQVAQGLVTNFHQPASTLLLLIAAFVGPDWRRIYQYALDHNYRFLSYGDGSLLWRE